MEMVRPIENDRDPNDVVKDAGNETNDIVVLFLRIHAARKSAGRGAQRVTEASERIRVILKRLEATVE